MRKILIFLLISIVPFFSLSFAEDTTCESTHKFTKTISLNIKPSGESTRIHAIVVCNDRDSSIIQIKSRLFQNELIRVNHPLDKKVGDYIIFEFFDNMIQK